VLQESALAGWRCALGEEHPHTIVSAWGLFVTLLRLGDDVAANSLLERELLTLLETDPATLSRNLQFVQKQVQGLVNFRGRETESTASPRMT
jgi:hypothetical protein